MDASAEDAGVLSAHRVGAVEPDDLLYLANNLLRKVSSRAMTRQGTCL